MAVCAEYVLRFTPGRLGELRGPDAIFVPTFPASIGSSAVAGSLIAVGPAAVACRVIEGFHDPPLGDVVLAIETAGVSAQQDFNAVSCPFGNLSGRHSPIEPRRQACVAQVVRATPQQGGVLVYWQVSLNRPRR